MSESPELTQIRAQIAFGMDCKAFMESQLGRYLTAKAHADIDAALESLKTASPTNADGIRKLQNDVKCAENFLLWIGEAVTEGENAERTFIESSE